MAMLDYLKTGRGRCLQYVHTALSPSDDMMTCKSFSLGSSILHPEGDNLPLTPNPFLQLHDNTFAIFGSQVSLHSSLEELQAAMRYQNWDVLLFPQEGNDVKTPLQEFRTCCDVVQDLGL